MDSYFTNITDSSVIGNQAETFGLTTRSSRGNVTNSSFSSYKRGI